MAKKTNVLIVFLVLVIVILAAFVLYAFLIGPAYTGFVVDRQTEGVQYGAQTTINQILTQIDQNGFVQIPIGEDQEGNPQSIILVRYVPPQQAQPQAPLA